MTPDATDRRIARALDHVAVLVVIGLTALTLWRAFSWIAGGAP